MKGIVPAVGLGIAVFLAQPAWGQTSSTTGSALDQRVAALEKELDDLKTAQAEATGEAKQPNNLRAFWDKGLRFETADKSFSLKVGGRINWDVGFIDQDKANKKKFGDIPDGTEFRRLRLELSGDIYKSAYYAFQVDFGSGTTALKDVLMGVRNIPLLGNVQAGHFYEEFSLEQLTSDKYDLFVEYSLPSQALTPQRNAGIEFFNTVFQDRMRYALGVFRETDDSGTELASSGYAVTGRVSGLPWMTADGKGYLHLGGAWSHREPPGDSVSFSTFPEWHQSSKKFVSTGTIKNADTVDDFGVEAALVYGPFCVQAEAMDTEVSRDSGGGNDASFNGWYVQGGWFVTGGNRVYDKRMGVFTRPNITKNFDWKAGTYGAWEVVGRYSELDLNDSGAKIAGGSESDTTLGVNWYLNPNMRVMFNWIHAMTDKPDNGDADIFLSRFQVDF